MNFLGGWLHLLHSTSEKMIRDEPSAAAAWNFSAKERELKKLLACIETIGRRIENIDCRGCLQRKVNFSGRILMSKLENHLRASKSQTKFPQKSSHQVCA
ncbi:MAG: hypothetical protein JWM47_4583 [Acidimicrobiales bacterium]|nr:hypothetical protein [Acidimicrobiales bacterium]